MFSSEARGWQEARKCDETKLLTRDGRAGCKSHLEPRFFFFQMTDRWKLCRVQNFHIFIYFYFSVCPACAPKINSFGDFRFFFLWDRMNVHAWFVGPAKTRCESVFFPPAPQLMFVTVTVFSLATWKPEFTLRLLTMTTWEGVEWMANHEYYSCIRNIWHESNRELGKHKRASEIVIRPRLDRLEKGK